MYVRPNDSVLEETITSDTSGFLSREATWFYTSGNGQDISSYSRANGRLYFRTHAGDLSSILDDGRGYAYSATWTDGIKISEQDEAFQTTSFTYSAAGLLESSTQAGGSGGPPSVTTSFTYDAAGRLKSRSRGPAPAITESWAYDVGGRLLSHSVPGQGGPRTTTYSYANGSRNVTETLPNLATRTTTRHLDGPVISITGSAVVPHYLTYTLASDGYLTQRVQHDNATGDGAGVRKQNLDWLRRLRLETTSTTTAGVEAGTRYAWANVTGRLAWTQPTSNSWLALAPPTYLSYDTHGRIFRRWLDCDSTGSLVLDGADRVTEFAYGFVFDGGQWWSSAKTYTYPFDASATALLVNEDRTRVSFNGFNETTMSDHRTQDRFGNWTTTQTVVDRTNAIRYLRQTVPGSSTQAETEIRGGSVIRQVSPQYVTTLFAYDNWRRLIQQRQATAWPVPGNPGGEVPGSDPTALLERYTYYAGSDLVYSTGNWASYAFSTSLRAYDSMNRLISDVDAHGQTRYFQYNARGQLQYQWGSAQQPMRYEYDASYGWRTGMRTYRGGSGWTGASQPAAFSTETGEATVWVVEPRSGLVTEKRDALYPAHPAVKFAYTSRNELYRRTLSRGSGGIHTTYGYHYSTGELTSKDYSDSTTDVTYSYGRDGQLYQVTDATGTRTFTYGSYREVRSETLPSTFFGTRAVERYYHYTSAGGEAVGTLSATAFGAAGNVWVGGGQSTHQSNYDYDWTRGRLDKVNRLYDGSVTHSFTYAYETNGNRIASITGATDPATITTYKLAYDLQPWRNVVNHVKTYGANLALKTDYQSDYDWVGRRTKETAWTAPSLLGVSTPIEQTWTLNACSEVTKEEIKESGVVNTTKAREYTWDNGWNRTEAKTGGLTTTYSYASPSANQISSTTGHEAATFMYDEDGNLTSDGTWTYTYDAENRLKSASTSSYNAGFIYDYAGRRVRKSGLNGPFFFSTTYVYDGWNLIAELDQSLNPTRTYTWGPDANGEIGVSGAGGLLMISSGSNRWYPTYDARHNVTGLVDASGNFVAAYTYDAFGRITAQAGTQAANNPFGFATQFTDRDTGLIYFGHRFYSPKLGRFINRDPIAEAGGANLYAYAGNQVSDTFDVLGLLPMPDRLGGIFGDTGIFGDGLLGFGVNIGLRDTFNQLVSNYVWRTYLRVRHREERNRRIHSTYSAAELELNPAVPAADRGYDAFQYGKGGNRRDLVFSDQDVRDTIDLLRRTVPAKYFNDVIAKMTISIFDRARDSNSKREYVVDASGLSNVVSKILRLNRNRTDEVDPLVWTGGGFDLAMVTE